MADASSKWPRFPERFLLQVAKLADAGFGELEERREVVIAKRRFFTRALDLDEPATASHDDVHIDVGIDVLGIFEIEYRFAINNADTDCGDAISERKADWIGQCLLN